MDPEEAYEDEQAEWLAERIEQEYEDRERYSDE